MQINMEATIKDFFKSAREYAGKIINMYTDPAQFEVLYMEYVKLSDLEKTIIKIANTPAAERRSAEFQNLVFDVMYGHGKFGINSNVFANPKLKETKWEAFQAFTSVLYRIGEYYSSGCVFGNDPEPVLKAIKNWHYKTSRNIMKDFVYPFLPLSYFAKDRSEKR